MIVQNKSRRPVVVPGGGIAIIPERAVNTRACLWAAALWILGTPAHAEEIGCTSTTFRILGANDKICVSAFDDPKVPGVSCHLSQARTGGMKGTVGVAEAR